MFSIAWKINKQLAKQLRDKVKDQVERLRNTESALSKISILLYQSVMKNFRDEGRPVKWAGLSSLTLALRRKGKANGTPKILQDTGVLRMSIYPEVITSANIVKVGTNTSYAKLMQYGGYSTFPAHTILPRKKGGTLAFTIKGKTVFAKRVDIPAHRYKIPARPFLIIQNEDKVKFMKIAKDELGVC